MNFISTIIAVVFGLYLYDLIKEIGDYFKSSRTHKQLLRWKKECEDNIIVGKNVEENKSHLKVVEKSLEEFYQKNNRNQDS